MTSTPKNLISLIDDYERGTLHHWQQICLCLLNVTSLTPEALQLSTLFAFELNAINNNVYPYDSRYGRHIWKTLEGRPNRQGYVFQTCSQYWYSTPEVQGTYSASIHTPRRIKTISQESVPWNYHASNIQFYAHSQTHKLNLHRLHGQNIVAFLEKN